MILTVFDIETTGLDRERDSIIQFAGVKIDSDNNWNIIESLTQLIRPCGNYEIGLGAYFKHHISPDVLKDKPTMVDVGQKIVDFFNGSDNILTYNGSSFDIAFLKHELNKFGYDIDFTSKNCYDAFLEEKRRNGISLENTYLRYKGKTMVECGLTAHDALSDVKATISIFIAQQRIKGYTPENMYGEDNVIADMEFNGEVKPCFNIGKYKGISVEYIASIDQNYIRWCASDKCKFMDSTKNYIKNYLR